MSGSSLFQLVSILNTSAAVTYAVRYHAHEHNPYMQTLAVCYTPGCNNVYDRVERTEWFERQAAALHWVNQVGDDFIELRACLPVQLERHIIGTRDKSVMREEVVKEDVYSWVVKKKKDASPLAQE